MLSRYVWPPIGPLHSFYLNLKTVGPPSHFNFGEPVTSQSGTSVNRSGKDMPNLHCSNSTIEFLILVLSTPKGIARRTVIRDTWMKDPTDKNISDFDYLIKTDDDT